MRFNYAAGLHGFQFQNGDGSWARADEATIHNETVFVRTSVMLEHCAVRYAWQAKPETALENAAGLPASPFLLNL